MTVYMLDTNVLSHLARVPDGPVARRIELIDETSLCTSIVVASELRYGVAKKGSVRLATQVERVLGAMRIEPLSQPADDSYATLRAHLERSGSLIGQNDLFIAAHALALDCVLVTDNLREFERVPDLRVENWLR